MSEFDKFLIKGEMLEAMALTYIDRYNNCSMHVNASWTKATKLCRISFREPKYIIHINSHKVDDWLLTKKEQKFLMTTLWSDSKKYKGHSVWQALIIDYNIERYDLDLEECERISLNFKRKFSLKSQLSEYEEIQLMALPIDLPMPNYLKLH